VLRASKPFRPAAAALALMGLAVGLTGCSTGAGSTVALPSGNGTGELRLSSPAFADGGSLPARFTCDGQSIPPGLRWSVPTQPAEYVLVLTDPEAQGGTFVDWVLYGISPTYDNAGEGQGPPGARQGTNDLGKIGYAAPCPPLADPAHHYVFTMYALSSPRTQGLESGASLDQVIRRLSCCILASGTLTGTYRR
jgi:Raf kinase inhibitor-like YbhB/YbcL family protein